MSRESSNYFKNEVVIDEVDINEQLTKNLHELLKRKLIEDQKKLQTDTIKQLNEFTAPLYVKSEMDVRIESQEEFDRRELEQKGLILKDLCILLQEKLKGFEAKIQKQDFELQEEEQKKVVMEDLNQILSKDHKSNINQFCELMSKKMNISVLPTLTYLDTLMKTLTMDEEQKKILTAIRTNVLSFVEDSSQIFEYQKLLGNKSIHKKSWDVNQLVEKTLKKLKPIYEINDIRIDFENQGVSSIFCDNNGISLVLNSLIRNSIEACEKNGTIKIIVKDEGSNYLLSIIDDGEIIPEVTPADLFSGTSLIDATLTKEQKIGLGIAICRLIVQNHSGKIYVEGKMGRGTDVTITLPKPISHNFSSLS